MTDPVAHWYLHLYPAQKKSFCMLVRHFCIEVGRIGQEDGFFIALNYAVSCFHFDEGHSS